MHSEHSEIARDPYAAPPPGSEDEVNVPPAYMIIQQSEAIICGCMDYLAAMQMPHESTIAVESQNELDSDDRKIKKELASTLSSIFGLIRHEIAQIERTGQSPLRRRRER